MPESFALSSHNIIMNTTFGYRSGTLRRYPHSNGQPIYRLRKIQGRYRMHQPVQILKYAVGKKFSLKRRGH
jgi:hypothetical protein